MICLRGLAMLGQLSLDGAFQEVRVKVTRLPSDDLTPDVPELTCIASLWLSEPLILLNSKNRGNNPAYLHGGMQGVRSRHFQSPLVLAEVLESSVLGRKPPYQMGRAWETPASLDPGAVWVWTFLRSLIYSCPAVLEIVETQCVCSQRTLRVASLRSEGPRKQEWDLPTQFESRVLYSDSPLKPPAKPSSIIWGMDTKRNKSLWPIFSMTCIWNSSENHT